MISVPGLPIDRMASAPDLHPVEHLERLRLVLIDSDNIFGPEQVIPTVIQQIKLIQRIRQGRRGADMRALLDVQAKFSEFAAWLHQDYGDHTGAEYWTNRALEWSQGAVDRDLTTFVLSRGAQLAGDMGDSDRAVDLATAAENMARPGSRLAAVGAVYAGQGHALAGDAYATRLAYDHARELHATMDDDPESTWGVWLDPAYIAVQESRSLSVVGEYAAAAEGFQTAIDALPEGYDRDRGVYLARAARAYAGIAEAEQASKMGLESLSIGLRTKSGRILTELASLDETLAQWKTPPVIEFRTAMAESIGRQV
jgi:tetratricopeptide (TPR) repeat protein